MNKESFAIYKKGCRDGIPVGLGYFAVAFSLGIWAVKANPTAMNWFQGFVASLFTIASAGEKAGFQVMIDQAPYLMMALVILVANCRYLLMSCALSQRVDPSMRFAHRIGMGFFVTDEIFALSIAQTGYLSPWYTYGLATTSVIPWAAGTSVGILAGDVLPPVVVSALSVAIYGMFIAIIIPPVHKDRTIGLLVGVSFALSFAASRLPGIRDINGGVIIVILTVLIAGAAAILKPIKDEDSTAENKAPENGSDAEAKA